MEILIFNKFLIKFIYLFIILQPLIKAVRSILPLNFFYQAFLTVIVLTVGTSIEIQRDCHQCYLANPVCVTLQVGMKNTSERFFLET